MHIDVGVRHIKLDIAGEDNIYATLLVRLFDLVAHLALILSTSMRNQNLLVYIFEIPNIFVLSNISSIG